MPRSRIASGCERSTGAGSTGRHGAPTRVATPGKAFTSATAALHISGPLSQLMRTGTVPDLSSSEAKAARN
eukprot:8020965-Alexandrium_andersonii.AAC.1